MKKNRTLTVISLIIIYLFTTAVPITGTPPEDWSDDLRLTNSIETSAFPSVAVEGNNIHVVFTESTSGDATAPRDLCYLRSIDNGDNWDSPLKINTLSGKAYDPKVAVCGSNVHMIWRDRADYRIRYIRSLDNGITWSNENIISDETYFPYGNHNIAVFENNVHVVYVNLNNKLTYINSLNNGDSWSNPSVLVSGVSYAIDTSIAVFQNNIHVIWYDLYTRIGERVTHIYYINSHDNGNNWGGDVNISTATGNTLSVGWPNIAVHENKIHAVFCGKDGVGGNREVFYSYSEDNGLNWTTDIQLSNSIPHTYNFDPTIALIEDNIYSAWYHMYVFIKISNNGGVNWTPDTRLSNVTSHQCNPVIASNQNTVHIVWEDDRDENTEIYYKKISLPPDNITMNIDINPDSLNLKSKGKWITCYIELPEGYDVRDIDATTVLLEGILPPILDPKYGFVTSEDSYLMDHDKDGIEERMLKFDRAVLEDIVHPAPKYELTVTGYTYSGIALEGVDSIRIFLK